MRGDVTMCMSSPGLVRDVPFGHSSKRRGQFAAMDWRGRWATEGA
jgi:hypothetical protein